MADVAALSASVLLRVAEFLKSLPADQLDDLAAGTAKLEVVPKGGRPAPRSRTAAAKAPSTVDIDEVRRALGGFTTLADATRYVDGLGLGAPALKTLATELTVTVSSKATKPQIRDAIVQAYVGDVLNSDAIRRQAAGA